MRQSIEINALTKTMISWRNCDPFCLSYNRNKEAYVISIEPLFHLHNANTCIRKCMSRTITQYIYRLCKLCTMKIHKFLQNMHPLTQANKAVIDMFKNKSWICLCTIFQPESSQMFLWNWISRLNLFSFLNTIHIMS